MPPVSAGRSSLRTTCTRSSPPPWAVLAQPEDPAPSSAGTRISAPVSPKNVVVVLIGEPPWLNLIVCRGDGASLGGLTPSSHALPSHPLSSHGLYMTDAPPSTPRAITNRWISL